MRPIHDRMPVILWDKEGLAAWLDPDQNAARLKPMLAPAPDDYLVTQPVSPLLSNVANESADLLGALPADVLFRGTSSNTLSGKGRNGT